jgi:hypothetical protein
MNEKAKAKAFQKELEAADSNALLGIINDVCDTMQTSQFRKPETKHKVEIMLRNKRPQVNNITREAYKTLCDFARGCSGNNSTMLGLISSFQRANAI